MDKSILSKRPFKTRNADEFGLDEILNLFVSPFDEVFNPFEYENSIIKGKMGSGKTMYLKANYAFHLYNIVPSLVDDDQVYLPVFIRLNDFQHLKSADEIYRAIIKRIVEGITQVYIHLQDAKYMARIHSGLKNIPEDILFTSKINTTRKQLLKLGADEYIEKLDYQLSANGKLKLEFLDAGLEFTKNEGVEIKKKTDPGIGDIEKAYKNLLEDVNGKIILLIDEASSLDKSFFKNEDGDSLFEVLMNQFRTAPYLRTKVAVYPHTYSDVLSETRYGDVVMLEENIYDENGYESLRSRTLNIIKAYLTQAGAINPEPQDLFVIFPNNMGDSLEQLINASDGNLRRIIHLLDLSCQELQRDKENVIITDEHVDSALKKHSQSHENLFLEPEKEFLNGIAIVCRSRSTFKFQFPYKAPVLYKYVAKSKEYNVLKIVEAGSGRKGTIYAFDYSFCVNHNIPTHRLANSEKIDRARSLSSGTWISRVATINDELVSHANVPGKVEGDLEYVRGDSGFIKGDDGKTYFFAKRFIIEQDQNKPIQFGKRFRFYPSRIDDMEWAMDIEIL
tara:strand:- start:504 stop:2192 length:1689 start_codon:yes stop_codon:yes gene_type:complete